MKRPQFSLRSLSILTALVGSSLQFSIAAAAPGEQRPARRAQPAPGTTARERPPTARPPRDQAAPRNGSLTGPTDLTRKAIRGAAALLAERHLVPRALDDDMSRQWMANYVDALDEFKVFFLQSEVERFVSRQSELGDKAKLGDASLAYEVFRLLVDRVQQRTPQWLETVQAPMDFTQDEELEMRPATYPDNEQQARDRMRKIVKYHLLECKAQGMDEPAARERTARKYRFRLLRFQRLDDQDLLELYVNGLVSAYDRDSVFTPARISDDFRQQLREQLDGIGAAIRDSDGELEVVNIIPGSPSAKDGRLKKGDIILGIGQGENGAIEDVTQLRLREVVQRIRGKAGTVVRLQIIRPGEAKRRSTFNLVRGRVQLQEVRAAIFERGQKSDDTPYKIGVIDVPSLYASTYGAEKGTVEKTSTGDVRRILEDPERGFNGAGVDLVVLDMRRNVGGPLKESLALAGLFIDSGPILQVRNRAGEITHSDDPAQGATWKGPVVVLTSHFSGSGIEIIAAALQDYKRALIVGDTTTVGHGTIRSTIDVVEPRADGQGAKLGLLVLVTEQFYRVNGESTQQRGVAADVVLSSIYEGWIPVEAQQPGSIPPDRIEAINHARFGWVRPTYTGQLQKLSAGRRRDSQEFRQLAETIANLKARGDAAMTPLAEAKAIARLKPIREDDKLEVTDFEKSFVNDEVLNIGVDYLHLLEAERAKAPRK